MEKQFMENNLNPQDSSMLFHLAQMQINSNILGFFRGASPYKYK